MNFNDGSTKSIIDAILVAEGGAIATNDPSDRGGRTQYGISEKSHPGAWADNHVTEEEARAIYMQKYVIKPGFDKINDQRLRHFLVDFAVNSGPGIAIQYLQRAVNTKVDGVLGPKTAEAANQTEPRSLVTRLVAERVKMAGRIVTKDPSQLKFLNGWLNRFLDFI
jgi:lysozyme family protein